MHVIQRGHNRDATFHDAQDFECYREILWQASTRTACAIHAYALMSNHIHLLLTPANLLGASRLMQRAGSQYVRYWNKRHRRSGTLWDGRFKSSIVETDRYFLACCRYIDRNPVQAGIVADAQSYPWSSHRHLAYGLEDRLLTSHPSYEALAETAELRQATYREYCAPERPGNGAQAIRSATRCGAVAGRPHFVVSVERLLQRPAVRQAHGGDRKSDSWRASQKLDGFAHQTSHADQVL